MRALRFYERKYAVRIIVDVSWWKIMRKYRR